MHPILDIFLPRFVTDRVAVVIDGDNFYPVCLEDELTKDVVYHKIVTVHSFNLFGFAIFPRLAEEDKYD